jgi:hypothetical protein
MDPGGKVILIGKRLAEKGKMVDPHEPEGDGMQ